MLNSKPLNKFLFLDIECIPQKESFYELSEHLQELFLKKFKKDAESMIGLMMDLWDIKALATEEWRPKLERFYQNRAALTPEFLKVVCISVGWIDNKDLSEGAIPEDMELVFKHRTFIDHDEKKLLSDFYNSLKLVLDKPNNPSHHLVGHNIFMYDLPVLATRFIINKLSLPAMLDTDQKKTWNLPYIIDTRESWKMTRFDGSCSLELLCEVLGVASPKEDISGKDVFDVYYKEKNLRRIGDYCFLDIFRLCECVLRMKSMPNKLVLS